MEREANFALVGIISVVLLIGALVAVDGNKGDLIVLYVFAKE